MSVVKITDNVYSVGVANPNLRVFDIVMTTDYGTSYNSYIIRGSEKTVLIETCHKRFYNIYINNIKEVCDLSEIDYIILNHNEPDHSGSLADLVDLCPNAQIITSQAGSIYLKNITNSPSLKITVAKDGHTLDIGDGEVLKFINAPFLHWPDSMFTWYESKGVLFSCDFFGSHYCEPYTFDTNVAYADKYYKALKYYFDAIFGPFKPYVISGLNKINNLDIKYCCTSHGPVLTDTGLFPSVRQNYLEWSTVEIKEHKTIPVFYCTAYGNTAIMAEAITAGIREVLPTANVTTYDIIEHDMSMLQSELNSCDAFCIGAPTINRDAAPVVWNLLSHIDAINCQKKQALVFGSYGWSGEAIPNISSRLQGLKFNLFGEGLKVQFVPSPEDIEKAKELGKCFGENLK